MPQKGKGKSSPKHRRPSKHLKCTKNINWMKNENSSQEVGRPKIIEIDNLSSSSSSSNNSFSSAELIMDDMHSVETTDTERKADNIRW